MAKSVNFDQTIRYLYQLISFFQLLIIINKIQNTLPGYLESL
jgi:hypothetical protein